MPNWSDPLEIRRDTEVFAQSLVFLLGLYTWEVLGSLGFEWQLISGQKKFTWLMLVYFSCKYSLLLCLIMVNVTTITKTEVNCEALYTFNQISGNTAVGTASTLLMFRTFAIWSKKKYIVIPLCILSLGQWAILLNGYVSVKSSWSSEAMTCVVHTQPNMIKAMYVYTMAFDLTVLILSITGLLLSPGHSTLWKLLFTDGIVYFVVSFTAYLFPVVFAYLNLNSAMDIICAIPASVCSTVVACRSFVRLSDYISTGLSFPEDSMMADKPTPRTSHTLPAEVHICMDTYTCSRHSANGSFGPYSRF